MPLPGVADGIWACSDLMSRAPIDEGAAIGCAVAVALGDANEKAPPNGAGAKSDDDVDDEDDWCLS